MRFMDAFLDELGKLAATNVAADVAPQYAPKPVKQTAIGSSSSADSKSGFFKTMQRKLPSALSRNRTGNMVGAMRP